MDSISKTTAKRTWRNLSAYGYTRDILNLVSLANRRGYKTERPVWLAGEVHVAIFATDAEFAGLRVDTCTAHGMRGKAVS